MKKQLLMVLSVNDKQGFFLDDIGAIAGCYSHTNKEIYIKNTDDFWPYEVPKNYQEYKIKRGHIHFGITWM